MYCKKCGGQIPDDSVFCNRCGAKLQGPAASAPPPTPAPRPSGPIPAPQPAPSNEPEQTIWEGRFCGRALGSWYALWMIWFFLLAYVYLFNVELANRTAFLNIVMLVLAFGPLAYLGFVHLKKSWSIRYKLTTHRLFREVGLVSRKISEVELFRVDDVTVKQGILQRIFNVGDVTVVSSDATEPRLDLAGIDKPVEVKEQIRTYVRRRRDRALYMENI